MRVLLLAALFFLWLVTSAFSGSAKWNLDPASNDWSSASNWTPATIPNGSSDVATFGISNTVNISSSVYTVLNSIVFEPDASAYVITATPENHFDINGGIVNDSGAVQNFRAAVDDAGKSGAIIFANFFPGYAKAGRNTVFTASARKGSSGDTGDIEFVYFASADEGVFINEGGEVDGSIGGQTRFFGHSNGGNAVITSNGGTVSGALGGTTMFLNLSDAQSATLIANGGVNGGQGGQILFSNSAKAASAQIKVFGNGQLVLDAFRNTGLTIGSLEGDGIVTLNGFNLTVGSLNLSTTFSGTIENGNLGNGSLTKIGTGTLTLAGANTYRESTTVAAGALRVSNRTGSATGKEAVKVEVGTFGGGGIVAGAVTIGTGSGPGAFVAPGVGASVPTKLTLQSSLTFKADGCYTYKLNTNKAKADQILANGVNIETGAQFDFNAVANRRLQLGQVFTAISNTSVSPIIGTFANLPDGSTFTAGRNKFEVSYSDGDGNDLTLTVVP